MKLNPKVLRYMSAEEFRVLTAVEMGMKNHEVVSTVMIGTIAGLRHGGSHKLMGELARNNLIARVQNIKYDGYRLTYGGLDYLALRAFSKRGTVYSVGQQIGVGKESDIYLVADEEGQQCVLKLQRLGRISFRSIKNKRDYMQKRKSASWMYMSRLAAIKEYAFMKVLHEHGFPVPRPIDHSRHCVVMELVQGFVLNSVDMVDDPGHLYSQLMDLIVRLAACGLIHGDFNEFNIMLTHEGKPIIIDFPQMVSVDHPNAAYYFDRDVECIRVFFRRRFAYESRRWPTFERDAVKRGNREFDLDVEAEASGFTRKMRRDFEELEREQNEREGVADADHENAQDDDDDDEEEETSSEEEEEESSAADEEDVDENEEDASVDELTNVTTTLDINDDEHAIESLDNHTRMPFRQLHAPIPEPEPNTDDADDATPTIAYTAEQLKERVRRAIAAKHKAGAQHTGGRRRNMNKTAEKRRASENVKQGGDYF